ncbi:MAG: spermidine synthase [Fimbriiglobus sp.]
MRGILFAIAIFTSAALVMLVQPLAGKTLLPAMGGTPAVWNTCLVFFQALLLAGYAYANGLTRLKFPQQVLVHLGLLGLGIFGPLVLKPFADVDTLPAGSDDPVLPLLGFLFAFVGLPFLALAPTSPLLQAWFARHSDRPYLLYAGSNLGSLLGLLSYPLLVEPRLNLAEQSAVLAYALPAVAGMILLCAWTVSRAPTAPDEAAVETNNTPTSPLKWLLLAAIPSSLLMGATTHITTDIAPIPLFWVVPLALYLLSFIIVFGRWPAGAHRRMGRLTPMLLVFVMLSIVTRATEPMWLIGPLHLVGFLAVALLCHGELAGTAPAKDQLTRFYLMISLGGVLGGTFNAILAPWLFARLGSIEYPLMLLAACLVRPSGSSWSFPRRDLYWLAGFAAVLLALNLGVPNFLPAKANLDLFEALIDRTVRAGLMFGLPAAFAFGLALRAVRFTVALTGLYLISLFAIGPQGRVLEVSRNFFGTLRVTQSTDGQFVCLVHGTTLHGQERLDEPHPPRPLMYYHHKGPVGHFFAKFPSPKRVAAVGLGVGAMADYTTGNSHWTFYEIDPDVLRLARDSGHFHFLPSAKGRVDYVLGDARLKLAQEPDQHFDLIVLDAFSSDAIPVHLLTQEAFALYAQKLTKNGVLLMHLSNRYLDLVPLVTRLGESHSEHFETRVNNDFATDTERDDGKFPSTWVLLTRQPSHLGPLDSDRRFQPTRPTPGPTWTDSHSDLLKTLKTE